MSASLHTTAKVIGIKQSQRAILDGQTSHVYIAKDAERRVIDPIVAMCLDRKIKITWIETKEILGKSCDIDVGATIVAILNAI